jgi:hypothetical protein
VKPQTQLLLFGNRADHPLTADWIRRGGVFDSTAQRLAHNDLAREIARITSLDTLYGTTFVGGVDGCRLPFFTFGGTNTAAMTNNGYVPGDYGATTGLVQAGSDHLIGTVTTAHVGITGFAFGAYHSGNTAAQRILMGGGGASNVNLLSMEYRSGAGTVAGVLNATNSLSASGGTAAAGATVALSGVSASDFRVYQNGAEQAIQTGTRSAIGGSVAIAFGGYNANGSFVVGATATQTFSVVGNSGLTPTQMADFHAAVVKFLARIGRPIA